MNKPKILIVSHNPLSDTQSNGKTIASLLSNFPKESLAQLYFTMDTPDFTICNNFFRITDLDVLKNFFLLNNDIGSNVSEQYSRSIKNEKKTLHKNKIYNFIRKLFVLKVSFMTTIRDFIWNNSYYYSKKFEAWLDDFNPDFIFFQSSNCCFAFDFVYKIAKKRNIKIIMQTTDDYLSYKKIGLFFNYNVYKLRKVYKKVNSETILILPISDKMKKYYNKLYPNVYYTAMNSVVPNQNIKYKFDKHNIKILYAGNLGLNRYKTIYNLAKIINDLTDKNISIEVYSIEKPSDRILNKINRFECCKYLGSLNKEQLEEKRNAADVLLHVEAFDSNNKHLTRYSISTKIPELMNSGRVILAVGPNDIASIEYLQKTNSAFIINSNNYHKMHEQFIEFLSSNKLKKYVKNGEKFVKQNHDMNQIQKYIEKVITENYNEK